MKRIALRTRPKYRRQLQTNITVRSFVETFFQTPSTCTKEKCNTDDFVSTAYTQVDTKTEKKFVVKDVRAHCYCASLLRTLFIRHARARRFQARALSRKLNKI